MGGLTGGAIGGLVGGLNATALGGKFWHGDDATNDFVLPNKVGYKVGEGMEYSNEYGQEFMYDSFGRSNRLTKSVTEFHADGKLPSNNYSRRGHAVYNKEGLEVGGTTVYKGTGKGYAMYLYRGAFVSKDMLFTTIGHELTHVGIGLKSRMLAGTKANEASAYRYSIAQLKAFGLSSPELETMFNGLKDYYNPALDLGPAIQNTRPWLAK